MLFTWILNHSWVKVSHSTLLQEPNRKQRLESSSTKFCALIVHLMFSVLTSVVLTPVSQPWDCLFQLRDRQTPAPQFSSLPWRRKRRGAGATVAVGQCSAKR